MFLTHGDSKYNIKETLSKLFGCVQICGVCNWHSHCGPRRVLRVKTGVLFVRFSLFLITLVVIYTDGASGKSEC